MVVWGKKETQEINTHFPANTQVFMVPILCSKFHSDHHNTNETLPTKFSIPTPKLSTGSLKNITYEKLNYTNDGDLYKKITNREQKKRRKKTKLNKERSYKS